MGQRFEGVILDLDDFREDDRFMTIYTKERGKIRVLIKSAKKITSKLAGFCQPFALLKITIAPGQNFYHLVGAIIQKNWPTLKNDYEKIIIADKVLNIVDQAVEAEKGDKKIFQLIVKFLEALSQIDNSKNLFLKNAFLLKLASFLGYQPQLKYCLKCHQKNIATPIYFNYQQGGLYCAKCQKLSGGNIEVSKSHLILLNQLLYKKFEFWQKRYITSDERQMITKNIEPLLEKFIEWHIR